VLHYLAQSQDQRKTASALEPRPARIPIFGLTSLRSQSRRCPEAHQRG
jgi:hypothetical protein